MEVFFLIRLVCRFSLFNMLESGFRTRKNKRSNRSMEVKLTALLGNYDGPSDLSIRQPTDRPSHRKVSPPIKYSMSELTFIYSYAKSSFSKKGDGCWLGFTAAGCFTKVFLCMRAF